FHPSHHAALGGIFRLCQRHALRRAGGPFGLVHDDVAPVVGVGRQAKRMEVDDRETRNLRLAGPSGELAKAFRECRRLRVLAVFFMRADGGGPPARPPGSPPAPRPGAAPRPRPPPPPPNPPPPT